MKVRDIINSFQLDTIYIGKRVFIVTFLSPLSCNVNEVAYINYSPSFHLMKLQINKFKSHLACLMITYPSTNGVFEENVKDICSMVHEAGGQVCFHY